VVLLIPLGAPRVLTNPIHLKVQVHHFRLAQVHEAQEAQEAQEVQKVQEVQEAGVAFDVYIALYLVREEFSTSV
jgi:hypothetical protein